MKKYLRVSLIGTTLALNASAVFASTAYGDLNNFDVVNDTGEETHGFEIELDDVHSTDITYTYDWNHYGAPKITEDTSDPLHPRVFVRYEAKYDANTGLYSAYTASPTTPLAPTDGHMCTDPSANQGCEHFGVGYYGSPTVVRYNWLVVDTINPDRLVHGPAVNVATPNFTYYPPIDAQPPQVVAVIQAPPPPPPELAPPVQPRFGDPVWAKEIKTSSKNNQLVKLEDLVSDDPNRQGEKNWLNDKPNDGVQVNARVEIEWRMMQTEFAKVDGGVKGQLAGAAEELPHGDENVTRRYEFFKYAGSSATIDDETGEAMCDEVGADGVHGKKSSVSVTKYDPNHPGETYTATVDCTQEIIVGEFIGAQMAGFDAKAEVGLIDHIEDGFINQAYTHRTVVVGGNSPYSTVISSGSLPVGLTIDSATAVLSGTPTTAGTSIFTVSATDADGKQISKSYTVKVVDPNAPEEGHNQAPVAAAQQVSATEETAATIVLTANDVDSDPLTYAVSTGPAHGTLSGAAPNLIYVPQANFNGPDSFSFTANDGQVDSAPAIVNIAVSAVNDAPTVPNITLSTAEDVAKSVVFMGQDVDGDALTYTVISGPSHGVLSGVAPNLTYTPAANYFGPDSLTFKANDGKTDSAVATLNLTVTSVNDAPVATSKAVTTAEDTKINIAIQANDVEGSALTYAVGVPAHGTLSGTAPNLIYTPAANYFGADSFTFKANDGTVDSAPASIGISVTAVNDAPIATADIASTKKNTAVTTAVLSNDTDPDGDALTVTSVGKPLSGSTTIGSVTLNSNGTIKYTPKSNWTGTVKYTYTIKDSKGAATSSNVTVSVTP